MKKAFDANVSRARPRLRLGAMMATEGQGVTAEQIEAMAQAVAREPVASSREAPPDLSSAVKSRLSARVTRPSAAEALSTALQGSVSAPAAVRQPDVAARLREGSVHELDALEGAGADERVAGGAPPSSAEVSLARVSPSPSVEAGASVAAVQPSPGEANGAWVHASPGAAASAQVASPPEASLAAVALGPSVEAAALTPAPQPSPVEASRARVHASPSAVTSAVAARVRVSGDAPAPGVGALPRDEQAPEAFRAPASVNAVSEPARTAAATVVAQSNVVAEVVMSQSRHVVQAVRAAVEAPAEVREVQTAPIEPPGPDASERRERLRERLKAVRENPRPEPLPETVAEAGVLAVERIAALQTELTKTRAMNLALSQDLEAARRQAERATEEARLRMDEARRLAAEMEGRVHLLAELERELAALEGERNEALLALQESRAAFEASEREKHELGETVAAKDRELESSLLEEERLASELEAAHEAMMGLRRGADALKGERDMLARQVADLTKERAELLEARKALEAVHRALAKASVVA
ncbi:MAG: extensin-like protein [Myxococcaceae bacterium]|nr:extensin-like protein [Myxococcaceae bacterium]MCA3014322.1 extensin-like protein [Myxococcaceae bacterium]